MRSCKVCYLREDPVNFIFVLTELQLVKSEYITLREHQGTHKSRLSSISDCATPISIHIIMI